MKKIWTAENLATDWLILPGDQQLIEHKRGATRLGFALLLKFFQLEGRFPLNPHEVPKDAVKFVAQQVGVDPGDWQDYPWQGRSAAYHRTSIRKQLGFQETTAADVKTLKSWLIDEILNNENRLERLFEAILERCRALHIEPPTQGRIRRLLGSALQEHEKRFCNEICKSLDRATMGVMDDLLEAKCYLRLKMDPPEHFFEPRTKLLVSRD
jgi:hypothetical protein